MKEKKLKIFPLTQKQPSASLSALEVVCPPTEMLFPLRDPVFAGLQARPPGSEGGQRWEKPARTSQEKQQASAAGRLRGVALGSGLGHPSRGFQVLLSVPPAQLPMGKHLSNTHSHHHLHKSL